MGMISRVRPQTALPTPIPNVRATRLGQSTGLAAMITAAHLTIGCSFAAEMLAPEKVQAVNDASLTDVDGKDVLNDTVEDILDGGKEADALADVALDTIIDVNQDTPDVIPDVIPDVEHDTPLDTILDVIPDITEDVVQDVAEDVKPDIIPDVIEDIAQDIIPDITEDVIQDVLEAEAEADVADGPVCSTQNFTETENWQGTIDPQNSLDITTIPGSIILGLSVTSGSYIVTIDTGTPFNNFNDGATLNWNADTPSGTSLIVETESGDGASNWSGYLPLGPGNTIVNQPNRFLHAKFIFSTTGAATPQFNDYTLNFCAY
ncbi:hypothetical protein A3K48_05125 [candidate division WOR-1 bacterium RIFOXYA12_FULL_52_29]|uniref:Uncharacterized protein n=1 Tax=candidate division WOR-1 bacterium RIFOXYC12_FULL_54_18 TaxID=1802584 RepID=A0A1F4T6K0_UNCSA|nr:MAG: hypothetical protein A3K44_05125 [candidate division WOR-1 bacterium RIFOXYA2_FULL_51_19]OGC17928.1 MAG: hypothetical protein A3K48_05125 [candidate division WOR-1 bacterium RIFOXYA12_FULL_52_29]OGC26784.1 MAG: hypothetical protein A3K32_05120 [candidate division WOR-1 bacterium RIFOXYB2_FULL_45_9]OGC28345.1 MAG: hypothetical protein A3K49_05125 [candidate division WOR-1 bacterium RIFOXYC12_FULL_54_18]OGC31199.1 MAG: hypothetical protein A2346_07495 [candidate division WOR-1 bacterium R